MAHERTLRSWITQELIKMNCVYPSSDLQDNAVFKYYFSRPRVRQLVWYNRTYLRHEEQPQEARLPTEPLRYSKLMEYACLEPVRAK